MTPRFACGSRCREWHRSIPDYGIKPGHEKLECPPGLCQVKDLMLAWN